MRTALRLDEGALECFSVPFLLVRPFSKKKKKRAFRHTKNEVFPIAIQTPLKNENGPT
jgi:hypothetical protein